MRHTSAASGQEFYLVIHGETDAHANEKICGGGWDIPLNEEGLAQARKLARVFQKDKLGVRVIVSSPLLRCIQTTDVLHDKLKVKVRVVSGLAERHLGHWEKMNVSEISGFSPLVEQIPGGESLNRFKARVQETTNHIVEIGFANKGAALIVTHGFFAATLLGLLGLGERKLDRCTLYRFWRDSATSPWQSEEMI